MSKNLYFRNVAATTHRGDNTAKLAGATSWWTPLALAETPGSGAATLTAASVAGTTVGIEFNSGSLPAEFISEPLSADFTIAGTITGNLWGFESTMNDNTAINFVVDKIDGATGAITQIAKSARVTELAVTTAALNFFTVTPTSTACKRGDRIRIRPFIDDAGAAMIVGTTTFSYNGPTASVAGDSYIQFTEDLTFERSGDPVLTLTQAVDEVNVTFASGVGGVPSMRAQPFVAQGSTLSEVTLRLGLSGGTPSDNLLVEIRADSGGVPSATVLATVATLTAAQANGSPVMACSVALTPGLTYWLVVSRSGALASPAWVVYLGTNAAWLNHYSYMPLTSSWSVASDPRPFVATFRYTGALPTYYLTDTAETINPGSATEKQALTSRGSGSVNAVTNTAAGPTAPIQITASAGGTAIEWYTPPLEAVTLGGKAKVNLRGLESNASANASLCVQIAVTAGDGSGAVVWGKANIQSDLTLGGEIGTSDAAYIAWVAGDDVAVTAGQRLRFRIYVEDPAIGPLVTGFTTTVSYNGTTAAAAGDAYVILPVVVVEQSTGTAWTATPSDSVSMSDSTATQAGKEANIPDTLALADAVAFQAAFARTIPDTLAVADAQTVARDIQLAIPDTLTLADATVVARDIAQPVADTVALADAATSAAGKGVSVPDTVSVSDAQVFDRALTLADTVALTDVVAQAEEIHIADTLALSDLCDPVKSTGSTAHTRTVDDTVAVADAAPTFQLDRAQAVADTLGLADALTSQAVLQRALADTVAPADSLASQADLLRTVADTVGLSDLCDPVKTTGSIAWTQPIADTVALADAIASTATLLRTVADTLALVDAINTSGSGAQTVADNVAVTDAIRLDRTLNLADTVSLADQLVAAVALARTIADTLTLADSVTANRGLTKALADTVALADLFAFELQRNLAFADNISVTDAIGFQAVLERLLADTLFVADSITSDSIVPTPLPPGWIDRGSRGRIDRAGSGRVDLTNHGRLGTSRTGRLARTVTRV